MALRTVLKVEVSRSNDQPDWTESCLMAEAAGNDLLFIIHCCPASERSEARLLD